MLAKIMPPNTNLAISIKNFPISASIAYFLSFSIIYRYVVLTKIRNKSRKRKTECFVFSISVFYALICVADTETQSFIFIVKQNWFAKKWNGTQRHKDTELYFFERTEFTE